MRQVIAEIQSDTSLTEFCKDLSSVMRQGHDEVEKLNLTIEQSMRKFNDQKQQCWRAIESRLKAMGKLKVDYDVKKDACLTLERDTGLIVMTDEECPECHQKHGKQTSHLSVVPQIH